MTKDAIWENTAYRALTARSNYLGQDRPDLQYASKEVRRSMSNPDAAAWTKLKRIGRYVAGHRRLIWTFKFEMPPGHIIGWSDTDFAGCKDTRK